MQRHPSFVHGAFARHLIHYRLVVHLPLISLTPQQKLQLQKSRLRVSYSIPCYGAGRTESVYSRSAPTRRSTGSKRRGGRRSLCRATSAIRRPAAEKTAPKQRRL